MALHTSALALSSGATVPAVRLAPGDDLGKLAAALSLPPIRGALAMVGGAKDFDGEAFDAVRAACRPLLAALAEMAGSRALAVVDGGTPFGVMRLIGEARAQQGGGFPLIGVVPSGKVTWHDRPLGEGGATELDPNHSAFVLVDAAAWGGESDTLAAVTYALAGESLALEVLVNGGDVARADLRAFLRGSGRLVVVQGSGRLADEVAAALKGGGSDDPNLRALAETGRAHAISIDSPPGEFADLLARLAGW